MDQYLTVTALSRYIEHKFDHDPHLQQVYVKGELTSVKHHNSGNIYAQLKDQEGQNVININVFRNAKERIEFAPKDGDEVLILGRVNVYSPHSKYNIIVNQMSLSGEGILMQKLEALKKKFESLGYFDEKHKKPIPRLPEHIVVVTSSTGSVIQDINRTLSRRYPLVKVTLINTLVQGSKAAKQLVEHVKIADRLAADIVIVARGGGSMEDLWCFNDEQLAKTIFEMNTPVITAIGHETDQTLVDFVSDRTTSTPTAAAEVASKDKEEIFNYLKFCEDNFNYYMNQKLYQYNESVNNLTQHPFLKNPSALYEKKIMQRDEQETLLNNLIRDCIRQLTAKYETSIEQINVSNLTRKIEQRKYLLYDMIEKRNNLVNSSVTFSKHQLKEQMITLHNVSPLKIIDRGFTLTEKGNQVVKDASMIKQEDHIKTTFRDGFVLSQVYEVNHNDKSK